MKSDVTAMLRSLTGALTYVSSTNKVLIQGEIDSLRRAVAEYRYHPSLNSAAFVRLCLEDARSVFLRATGARA